MSDSRRWARSDECRSHVNSGADPPALAVHRVASDASGLGRLRKNCAPRLSVAAIQALAEARQRIVRFPQFGLALHQSRFQRGIPSLRRGLEKIEPQRKRKLPRAVALELREQNFVRLGIGLRTQPRQRVLARADAPLFEHRHFVRDRPRRRCRANAGCRGEDEREQRGMEMKRVPHATRKRTAAGTRLQSTMSANSLSVKARIVLVRTLPAAASIVSRCRAFFSESARMMSTPS